MDHDWSVPLWGLAAALALLALLLVVLLAAVVKVHAQVTRRVEALDAATAALERLQARVRDLEAPHPGVPGAESTGAPRDYLITRLGQDDPATGFSSPVDRPSETVPVLPPAVFADAVLRETAVQAASLAHGVRRALSAESRNRVRFVYRTEVKRSRRQRRLDLRAARREWEARRRAAA